RGGKDNNAFDAWTEDGKHIAINPSRDNPAARDSFMIDVASGNVKLLARNPGVGGIERISHDGRRALLGRVRSRGDNNLYLLDLSTGKDTLLTQHDGVAQFFGQLAPDGTTVYIGNNKDRDSMALSRMRLGNDGSPGRLETLAERADAELDGLEINHQGTLAALLWNVKGREELTFLDLRSGKQTPGPKIPGEIAGGLAFSRDGSRLA